MYSEMFYNSRVKAGFDAMWEGCSQNGVLSNERIQLWSRYTREHWLKESKELRDEVKKKCEDKYAADLQAWKDRGEWNESAEAYET